MSYSNKTHVILINGEVQTEDISFAKPDGDKFLVYYNRNQEQAKRRLYEYALDAVTMLDNPEVIDPLKYDVYHKGELLEKVYVICHFNRQQLKYYTIGFANSRRDIVCPEKDIITVPKNPIERYSRDIPQYLTQMAYLHSYYLRAKKDQNDQNDQNDKVVILGEQYDHLRRGDIAPLLEAYLDPAGFQFATSPVCKTPLYPYHTNASQMEAVSKALSNRISVIQGPPGTGKTETILNILLNLVLKKKSVLVVAGSNSATENVVEKLKEDHLDFLVAKLGNTANKDFFVGHQKVDNLCEAEWDDMTLDIPAALSQIDTQTSELVGLFMKDRELHEAIERSDQSKVLLLRDQLKSSSYSEKREQLKMLSMAVVKKELFERFGHRYRRQTYTFVDLGEDSKHYESFMKDYPIVLSTAFSATKCIAKDSLFDYVIMDEASQIDVATGALALSVAQNAVIVGDVKQLSNVIKEEMKVVSQAIFDFFPIPEEYNYAKQSFLESVCKVFTDAPKTLLREHYRCHPKIVRYFNNEFYDGQLVAMTEDHGEENVLVLRTTVPGYHEADFTNHREEEEIEDLKIVFKIDGKDKEVGIISPYNNQVKRIDDDDDIEDDILVSNIHKFQGRQKDIIIISTVDNNYSKFVNNPNLINVAVSRAKKQLIIVTNGNGNNTGTVQHLVDYINNKGKVEKGQIKSLFDLLYDDFYKDKYDAYVNSHPKINEDEYKGQEEPSRAEIIAYGFITDVLKDFPNLTVKFRYPLHKLITDKSRLKDNEEINFVNNKDAHIDFMIFEKNTMKPFYALEIDGASYHIEGSIQDQRDNLKNGILDKFGIHLHRFNTKKSKDEKNTLRELLINNR